MLRPLVDARVVELLGGPATHPFLPLLEPRVAAGALAVGLDDARLRLGRAPGGIWVPECGYAPGLEGLYAAAGVERFLVDAPALHGDTAAAWPVGSGPVSASAATSRSATGSGHRGPATRARRTTATSTPSTTPRGSGRPG